MFGKFVTLILILVCHYSLIYAQNQGSFITGINGQVGFIIPHSEELQQISDSTPWGVAIDFSKLMVSEKAWKSCNCYSKIGLSINYYNYSNPEQLGSSYNLIFFAEPYLGYKKKLHASLRAGLGITYLDQVYDAVSNPDNLFYSSPLSFILIVQLKLNYRVNEHYNLYLNGSYNHISNGAISRPNKGMNFPTLGLGAEYFINPVKFQIRPPAEDLDKRKWHKYARLFFNPRKVPETPEYPEKLAMTLGGEAGVTRRLSRINGLLTGFEISYDGLFNEEIKRNALDYTPFIVSLHLGHYLAFGRFSFTQQFAWYTYKSYPFNNEAFFQRYALYWQFSKLLNCGFSLKTHGHIAEYMDIRLGVSF